MSASARPQRDPARRAADRFSCGVIPSHAGAFSDARSLACLSSSSPLAWRLGLHDAQREQLAARQGRRHDGPGQLAERPRVHDRLELLVVAAQAGRARRSRTSTPTRRSARAACTSTSAWTHTTGRPDVKIAVIDCGIQWDDTDLANKAYLNAAELANHKPAERERQRVRRHRARSPATTATATASSPSPDYRERPAHRADRHRCDRRLLPGREPERRGAAAHDRATSNQNCILDAGRPHPALLRRRRRRRQRLHRRHQRLGLLQERQRPLRRHALRPRHGRGARLERPGQQRAGRHRRVPRLPLHDAARGRQLHRRRERLRQGRRLRGRQRRRRSCRRRSARSTRRRSRRRRSTTRTRKASLVVASMADENSRHHNMPGAANHTLPVHAITRDGDDRAATGANITTTSTTFIAFNLCSNYGGQNMLSVSGAGVLERGDRQGRRRRGPALLGGARTRTCSLSAEEVMQLLKMNADLINVPESRSTRSERRPAQFFESLPYFSQRFGYGRPNIDKAMQAIDAGLIPPEVDLTSPAWFDVLYADRGTSPVPILGSVAAKRAQSLRLPRRVGARRRAGGHATSSRSSTGCATSPSTTTTGGPEHLAARDARAGQIDTAHTPDPDSAKFHENDRTITLRVRAIAHYAGGDVEGQARRVDRDRQRAERARRGPRAGLPHRDGRLGRDEPQARRHRRRRRARHRGGGLRRQRARLLDEDGRARGARRASRSTPTRSTA